ncbi:MAG: transcriptional regulator [Campylobacterota bacterium]|nr:transcriptional regulator [Campylobacterota bacterium]
MEAKEENIIKKTCKELGLTYRELGEKIGYGEGALKMSVSNQKVSEPMKKSIYLYMENLQLRNELNDYKSVGDALKRIINKV